MNIGVRLRRLGAGRHPVPGGARLAPGAGRVPHPTFGEGAGELVRYAQQAIGELTELEPIYPDLPEWYAQMPDASLGTLATIPLPPCDAGELKQRLAECDEYQVKVPIIEWGGREFVRVSVKGYNTKEDVGALVTALAALLPEVRR